MEYRASIFAPGYFGHFICAMGLIFISMFILIGMYVAAAIIGCSLAIAFLRLQIRRMKFLSDSFSYDGWLIHRNTPYSEIKKVVSAYDFGYPVDRFRGGQYCIVTNTGRFWVNLLWFHPSARREFSEQIIKRYRNRPVS